MPLPFAAFLPLIGSAIGAGSQILANQANKKNNMEIYDRTRVDALADWNRQNQYNSPSEQMKRFKEAGLSPHLIYGQTNTAAPVRSVDQKPTEFKAPQIDEQSMNIPLIAQQLDNLKKQGSLIDAQVIKTKSETDWRNLNNQLLGDTFYYKTEQERQKGNLLGNQAEKTRYDMYVSEQKLKPQIENILSQTALNYQRKSQIAEEILRIKQTVDLLGEKVQTEKFNNEIMQKINAMGVVGKTALQLLSFIFNRK